MYRTRISFHELPKCCILQAKAVAKALQEFFVCAEAQEFPQRRLNGLSLLQHTGRLASEISYSLNSLRGVI